MSSRFVTLQDRIRTVRIPLEHGELRVETIKRAFPLMIDVYYIDLHDNIPVMMTTNDGSVVPPEEGWSSDKGYLFVSDKEGLKGFRPISGLIDWSSWSNLRPDIRLGSSLNGVALQQLMDNGYSVVGHKCGYTATGTSGTASWLIENMNRRIVIMWSAPFNFDFYSNHFAVGLTKMKCKTHNKRWFDTMYNNKGNTKSLNFKTVKCRDMCEEAIIEDDLFVVSGTMGTSHKPEVKVIVKPKHWENVSPELFKKES